MRHAGCKMCGFCLLIVSACCVDARAETSATTFQDAVETYQQALQIKDRDERLAEFRRAEMLFERLLEPDAEGNVIQNADLLVNVGNAALQAERLGPAIVAYRRSLTIDSHHARAQQNLAHARQQVPQWARYEQQTDAWDSFLSLGGVVRPEQCSSFGAILFLLAAALVAAGIYWKRSVLRNLAVLPIVAWVVLLAAAVLNSKKGSEPDAVLVAEETIVRSADATGAPPRMNRPLTSGVEARVLTAREDWSRVRLSDGLDGWIPNSSFRRME